MKDQWQELFSELAGSLEKRDQAEKIQSLLLHYRARLQSFVDRLSGLQEKWNNLDSVKRRLRDEKQKILSQIRQLKAGWTEEEIDRIRRINLELPEQHRLMDEANRFQVISNKRSRQKPGMNQRQSRKIKDTDCRMEKTCSCPRIKAVPLGFCPGSRAGAGCLLCPTCSRTVPWFVRNYRLRLIRIFQRPWAKGSRFAPEGIKGRIGSNFNRSG